MLIPSYKKSSSANLKIPSSPRIFLLRFKFYIFVVFKTYDNADIPLIVIYL